MLEGPWRNITKDWKSVSIIFFCNRRERRWSCLLSKLFWNQMRVLWTKKWRCRKWRNFKSCQLYPWSTWSFYHSQSLGRRNTSWSGQFWCYSERSFQCDKEKNLRSIQKVYRRRSCSDRKYCIMHEVAATIRKFVSTFSKLNKSTACIIRQKYENELEDAEKEERQPKQLIAKKKRGKSIFSLAILMEWF